jgi:hypothetical protein
MRNYCLFHACDAQLLLYIFDERPMESTPAASLQCQGPEDHAQTKSQTMIPIQSERMMV